MREPAEPVQKKIVLSDEQAERLAAAWNDEFSRDRLKLERLNRHLRHQLFTSIPLLVSYYYLVILPGKNLVFIDLFLAFVASIALLARFEGVGSGVNRSILTATIIIVVRWILNFALVVVAYFSTVGS